MENLEARQIISEEEMKQADEALDKIKSPFLLKVAKRMVNDAEKMLWEKDKNDKIKAFDEYFMDENPLEVKKDIENNYDELKFLFDELYGTLASIYPETPQSNFSHFLKEFGEEPITVGKKKEQLETS